VSLKQISGIKDLIPANTNS